MPTSSAHAQYVVTETTDDGTGATAGTLSNAILQANATGGTISFNLNGGATTLTLTGSMYGISAAAPVTIIGGGTTINGNNFQAFTVNSGNVDFQNLTIANALRKARPEAMEMVVAEAAPAWVAPSTWTPMPGRSGFKM